VHRQLELVARRSRQVREGRRDAVTQLGAREAKRHARAADEVVVSHDVPGAGEAGGEPFETIRGSGFHRLSLYTA
jgi:hypothetical protein